MSMSESKARNKIYSTFRILSIKGFTGLKSISDNLRVMYEEFEKELARSSIGDTSSAEGLLQRLKYKTSTLKAADIDKVIFRLFGEKYSIAKFKILMRQVGSVEKFYWFPSS